VPLWQTRKAHYDSGWCVAEALLARSKLSWLLISLTWRHRCGHTLAESQTPHAGCRAHAAVDGSSAVPDDIFMGLLAARLSEPDCQARGWLLDGFPHTAAQAR
jgi:hypothetical protein